MKMNIVKWDQSMAQRCIDRLQRGYVPDFIHHEKSLNRSFQTGEWDDFQSKIDRSMIKTKR